MRGTLYLLPAPLGASPIEWVIPSGVPGLLNRIEHFAVEDLRSARRYLKKAGMARAIDDLHFYLLNEHTDVVDLSPMLEVLKKGNEMGILVEAGVPAVADPGARLVDLAHRNDIPVVPLVGPSSILMALMASGMNGQNFRFHGYIPIKRPQRLNFLKHMEKRSGEDGSTQIFIETPYRNMSLLDDILKACHEETRICLAADITLPGEYIKTQTVGEWRERIPDLHKRPTVFLMCTVQQVPS